MLRSIFPRSLMTATGKLITFGKETGNPRDVCDAHVVDHRHNASGGVGLIVIQEWWGLNDQIKRTTDRFAQQGKFIALSPDLYRGKVATKEDEASHLLKGMDWQGAIVDIRHAAKYLKEQHHVNKVAVTGFCMGGALTVAAGVHVQEVDVGICFYGVPPAALARAELCKVPMQCHFGGKDQSKGFSDPPTADRLELALKEAGVPLEFYRYAEADHAFMNEDAPKYDYNAEAAQLATQRLLAFISRYCSA